MSSSRVVMRQQFLRDSWPPSFEKAAPAGQAQSPRARPSRLDHRIYGDEGQRRRPLTNRQKNDGPSPFYCKPFERDTLSKIKSFPLEWRVIWGTPSNTP